VYTKCAFDVSASFILAPRARIAQTLRNGFLSIVARTVRKSWARWDEPAQICCYPGILHSGASVAPRHTATRIPTRVIVSVHFCLSSWQLFRSQIRFTVPASIPAAIPTSINCPVHRDTTSVKCRVAQGTAWPIDSVTLWLAAKYILSENGRGLAGLEVQNNFSARGARESIVPCRRG
jgi:hypothetical protein